MLFTRTRRHKLPSLPALIATLTSISTFAPLSTLAQSITQPSSGADITSFSGSGSIPFAYSPSSSDNVDLINVAVQQDGTTYVVANGLEASDGTFSAVFAPSGGWCGDVTLQVFENRGNSTSSSASASVPLSITCGPIQRHRQRRGVALMKRQSGEGGPSGTLSTPTGGTSYTSPDDAISIVYQPVSQGAQDGQTFAIDALLSSDLGNYTLVNGLWKDNSSSSIAASFALPSGACGPFSLIITERQIYRGSAIAFQAAAPSINISCSSAAGGNGGSTNATGLPTNATTSPLPTSTVTSQGINATSSTLPSNNSAVVTETATIITSNATSSALPTSSSLASSNSSSTMTLTASNTSSILPTSTSITSNTSTIDTSSTLSVTSTNTSSSSSSVASSTAAPTTNATSTTTSTITTEMNSTASSSAATSNSTSLPPPTFTGNITLPISTATITTPTTIVETVTTTFTESGRTGTLTSVITTTVSPASSSSSGSSSVSNSSTPQSATSSSSATSLAPSVRTTTVTEAPSTGGNNNNNNNSNNGGITTVTVTPTMSLSASRRPVTSTYTSTEVVVVQASGQTLRTSTRLQTVVLISQTIAAIVTPSQSGGNLNTPSAAQSVAAPFAWTLTALIGGLSALFVLL